MSPKRNHLNPIIWVLIIGKANAGPADGRPDEIANRKTTTKMNLNKKTSTTNVSAGNSANSMSYEFDNSYENYNEYDYGYDQTNTDFNLTESTTTSTITGLKDLKAKAQVPIGPLPLDESTEIIEKDLTVIIVTMSSMCLLIAAVAVGMCYTKRPSRSEIRSSTDRALSRGISLQDGTVHENEQLLDDDVFAPVQSQNKANTMKNV